MLKYLRITIAGVVLGLFLLLFLGHESLVRALKPPLLFGQFTPSAVNFLLSAAGLMTCGWLLILLLTFLTGRTYCSVLCPLGILQDVIWFVAKRLRRKKTGLRYQQPSAILRYGILGLTILTALLGSLAVVNLLDPYSLFGRMTQDLLKPMVAAVNNLLVAGLEKFDIFALSVQPQPPVLTFIALVTFSMFIGLTVLVAWRGRLYCQTICPVGALLGLVSRFALTRIRLTQTACTSCKRCERTCRAGCIDAARKTIDYSRCVVCFDCLTVCPTSALRYGFAAKTPALKPLNASKRKFLVGSVSATGAALLASVPLRPITKSIAAASAATPVTPPGSTSRAHFAERCTACHLCVHACPTRVIQPAWLEYGLQGVMQPRLDYATAYCDYDCNLCGQVCPTGAILPLPLAQKQLVQIGEAQLIKDRCIVYLRHEDCAACAEVCPTHAVFTVERDNVRYPETNLALCIGCGACEYVCPQNPKAIWIQGHALHAQAKEPFYDQAPAAAPNQNQDFPF